MKLHKIVVLILLALALVACQTAVTPTPVALRQLTPSAASTEDTPTAQSPTSTPLPPSAPRLLSVRPERGEELPVDAPIVLTFDQPMDRESVAASWSLSPEADGTWEWLDERTAQFVPSAPGLTRDAEYTLRLDTGVSSSESLVLQEAVEHRFRTVGYLVVSEAFPLPDSKEIACDTTIRVAFNRPVVPLVGVADMADLPQPLELSPAAPGSGEWINTSIYLYQPDEPLAPGSRYEITVAQGLGDQTGGLLAEDYTWSFMTQAPYVLSVAPEADTPYADPEGGVRITFAQAVDQATAESRFTLYDLDEDTVTRGEITWDENTLVFSPSRPLSPDGRYRATLEAGTQAKSGEQSISEDTIWEFAVAGPPRVLSINVQEGAGNVDRGLGLQITFSSPISRATFAEHLVISPTTTVYPYWDPDSTSVQLSTYLRPSTYYTISLGSKVMGAFGQALAAPFTRHFSTEAMEPAASLDCPARVSTLNSYATPIIRARHLNVSRVELALYELPVEDLLALHSDEGWKLWSDYTPGDSYLLAEESLRTVAPLDHTATISHALEVDGEPLGSGFYWLSLDARGLRQPDQKALIVSPWNVLLKTSQDELLVWVTDLASGQPVANVALAVYDAAGTPLQQLLTDDDGLALGAIEPLETWETLIVIASKGDDVGLGLRSWNQGISPWDFGLSMMYDDIPYRAHLYTEREIYRPEQTVHFKGILRNDDDGQYSLPSADSVEVAAIDGEGQQFWRETLPLSEMGTFWGEIELPEDAALGHYTLEATYRPGLSDGFPIATGFQVAEYRKPEFQVAVQVAQDDYLQGDTIQASAEASYYFGGPVANAAVQWQVMRRPYNFDRWSGKDYVSFDDQEYRLEQPVINEYGALVTEGNGVTDAEGRLTFSLPADIAEQVNSQVYTIEATITDLNNQSTSARAATTVHKGAYYIGLSTPNYVGRANRSMTVRAITVDTQGDPSPEQTLTLVAYRQEWYSVYQVADDGYVYWENEVRLTAVATDTLSTDDDAEATWDFTPPEGGSYKVIASGEDADGNGIRSSLYLWVSGSGYINWGQRNNDRLELVADAQTYQPGDTARILVPSPYQGAVQALLTIERAGLLEYRILTLEGNSEQIEIPILPSYAPNVFVSLTLIQGTEAGDAVPSFKMGYLMLPVSTEASELTVTIQSDRETAYQPRDVVTYDLQVSDYQGRPVQAELSLQLVDLAVEALTGAGGTNAFETFYSQRGLGVLTSASLAASLDRHNLEYPDEGKGGGGGGGDGAIVREDLPDTAYWAPAVLTDADGQAQVSVPLPDSLTTWRLRALGVTADTMLGQAQNDVVSTLDLLIRPVASRFFVAGDEPLLGAVVHNNTDAPLDATISLQADGIEIAAGEQQVLIPANSRVKVYWPAKVTNVSEAKLQYRVSAGELRDAIDLTLPVYRVSTPETVGTAGQVEDTIVERIRLPEGVDPTQGELVVNLEPSLAASLQEGLTYLRTYPYDCVEQTVSRFLPNVAMFRALRTLDADDAELSARLPQEIASGLQRLYALQNLDGGWGWWQGHTSSPELTAYVVQGLVETRAADLAVEPYVIDRAVGWMNRWLEEEPDTPRAWDQRAVVLYALALTGEGDLGRTVNLFAEREQLSRYAQGYLALTLQLLEPDELDRRDTLANEFAQAAIESASGVHWEEESATHWAMNTDLRTTAILLRAMVGLQPESSLTTRAARWLTNARTAGRWETTQENAWAILALCDYMVASGELEADYAYSLEVNGETTASGAVERTNLAQTIRSEVSVAELLSDADNTVRIARDDPSGQLYYSSFLRSYVDASEIRALDRGIIVQRAYYDADDPTTPIERADINDTVLVRLTMIAPHDLHFVVLEDPLPAGCEAIDASLQTSQSGQDDTFERTDLDDVPEPYRWYWRYAWASHSEIRDEKVALFAETLPRGTYEYSYTVRCSLPGRFSTLPATAYEMYTPDVFGRSDGGIFEIDAE